MALSDQALELADHLLEERSHYEAITEYRRFIFFNPEGEDIGHALYKMGLAYRSGYNWQEAIDALRASILATTDPNVADERRIVLATTLIASGNYSLARLELLKVSEFSEQPSSRLRALYFGGVAALYTADWSTARQAFSSFYSEYDEEQMIGRAREIDSIALKAQHSYKSPRLAKFLSAIIPGSGQIYAGDWRDGLNALALNGLAIGLIANAIYKQNYKDALLIFSISLRYYRGNIHNAEVDVKEYNKSLNRRSATHILQLVRADEP